jgi:hypothetical protein
MRPLEKFLLSIDNPPLNAVSRAILGFVLGSVFRAFSGHPDESWIVVGMFFGSLLALRIGPAVARRVLPFSPEARHLWAERRSLSKQYDSYQWQKLFWIGLGMLPYSVIDGGPRIGALAVTAFCLIGGCAGLVVWRRIGAAQRCAHRMIATTAAST